jgi:hypothetical protein
VHGVASGTNNEIRELGGVFGIAVLASVFAARGGYAQPQNYVDGLRPATLLGAAVVLLGAAAALLIRRRRQAAAVDTDDVDTTHRDVAEAARPGGPGSTRLGGVEELPALALSD